MLLKNYGVFLAAVIAGQVSGELGAGSSTCKGAEADFVKLLR